MGQLARGSHCPVLGRYSNNSLLSWMNGLPKPKKMRSPMVKAAMPSRTPPG
ncbi:MAG: hypothetical protein IPN44_07850 [Flavobacteriales bacterium]|nr:hypothetical protein [Flavobacteriales bacterium]